MTRSKCGAARRGPRPAHPTAARLQALVTLSTPSSSAWKGARSLQRKSGRAPTAPGRPPRRHRRVSGRCHLHRRRSSTGLTRGTLSQGAAAPPRPSCAGVTHRSARPKTPPYSRGFGHSAGVLASTAARSAAKLGPTLLRLRSLCSCTRRRSRLPSRPSTASSSLGRSDLRIRTRSAI